MLGGCSCRRSRRCGDVPDVRDTEGERRRDLGEGHVLLAGERLATDREECTSCCDVARGDESVLFARARDNVSLLLNVHDFVVATSVSVVGLLEWTWSTVLVLVERTKVRVAVNVVDVVAAQPGARPEVCSCPRTRGEGRGCVLVREEKRSALGGRAEVFVFACSVLG